jgi:serine/threonine protein kinase
MRADIDWNEPSEPEISIGSHVVSKPDEFKGNIVGERFGKYLLVGEIAVGGMAEVFLAVHKGVESFIKVVVIKRVLPHLTSNPDFVRMFIDEARLAARLEHPNIVRTYEFGEVDGQYFSAMEYLPGEDLGKTLKNLAISKQRMQVHVATGIASQLCAGLNFAHQFTDIDGHPLNLVHRDINPANIIITYGGEVKIIDFGVAKANTNGRTLTGTIKGKVSYMPPEQVLGREVDHRADVFSAGVVLWEMLTGRPLFLRNSEAATLYAIMNAPIHPPSRFRTDVSQDLDRIVARALARRPADRFESAEEMGHAIDDFMLNAPRYDARVLAGTVEELFGSTRAEAKRSIAQTRSLTRNISIVMKLRSEVRADLAERLDFARATSKEREAVVPPRLDEPAPPDSVPPETLVAVTSTGPTRSQRGLMIALSVVMLAGIVAGLIFTMRSEHKQTAKQVSASVEVDSAPSGAAIFVAGEPTGLKTPTKLTGITSKRLAIRLELANYVPVTRNIDVRAGGTVSTYVTLKPLQGRLVISGLPQNATIFVDGEEYAAGDVIPTVAGKHSVRIVVDGQTILEQPVEATAGDLVLKFAPGKLLGN